MYVQAHMYSYAFLTLSSYVARNDRIMRFPCALPRATLS